MNASTPKPILLTIAGPTAVGKTALCVRLAQQLGTEVVSADARQFFREMSIGTAKPTPAEMQGVPHHFIDSHSIAEEYSAGRYEADCLTLLDKLFARHRVVILTGGSGLYLQVVTNGLDELPPADAALRTRLQTQLETEGLPALLTQLAEVDPVSYARIDRQNHVRVLRALEVTLGSGRPFSSFHGAAPKAERPFQTLKIALTREREELYQRIDQRVDLMLAEGLLDEVKVLVPHRHAQALQTVGYQEIFDFLDGTYNWDEAVRLLKRNTRRYAKRQLTWLRRDEQYQWLHPNEAEAAIPQLLRG